MNLSKLVVCGWVVCAALVPASAFAGKFEVWTDATAGDMQTAIVSFAGDGTTQEAQADYAVPKGWQAVQSKALVAGSVCAVVSGGSIVRAVPPSGAGSALSSKSLDYCSFQFKRGADSDAFNLKPELMECASLTVVGKCGSSVQNLAK